MAKRKRRTPPQPAARRPQDLPDGQRSDPVQGRRILTHTVGALALTEQLLSTISRNALASGFPVNRGLAPNGTHFGFSGGEFSVGAASGIEVFFMNFVDLGRRG